MSSIFTCLLLLPSFPLTLLFSLSVHTITSTAILTHFLYWSCKTAWISVEISKPQVGVIPSKTMSERGLYMFQLQLFCNWSQQVDLPPWAKYPWSSELGPWGAGFSLLLFSHPAALLCVPGLMMLLPRECPQNSQRVLLSAERREKGISLG